jgi:beta-glucan synthesis-associated protein KRE6
VPLCFRSNNPNLYPFDFSSRLQFSLSPDPASWGSDLSPEHHEPDDYLHNPDPKRDRKNDRGGSIFTCRGLSNLGCLTLLVALLLSLLSVFPLRYPLSVHQLMYPLSTVLAIL